MDNISKALSFF